MLFYYSSHIAIVDYVLYIYKCYTSSIDSIKPFLYKQDMHIMFLL